MQERFLACLVLLFVVTGCNDHGSKPPRADTVAPAAIADLAAVVSGDSAVTLQWTAPGDDGLTGRAAAYEVRWSAQRMTGEIWPSATVAGSPPSPRLAGSAEQMLVGGLPDGRHYFAVRACDEAENWSGLSNIAAAGTGDTIPPGRVGDLRVSFEGPDQTVLSWTAPGADGSVGTATAYSIRYHAAALTEANWNAASPFTGVPAPGAPGTTEAFAIPAAEVPYGQFVAVKAVDEHSNWSALSNVVAVPVNDVSPPGAIRDLRIAVQSQDFILHWSAPGDDGQIGTAMAYSIRHSALALTEETWAAATPLEPVPAPGAPGSDQGFMFPVSAVPAGEFIAVKTTDERGNWSPLSNVVTVPDAIPPGAIQDLRIGSVGEQEFVLAWTAPGDDGQLGTAAVYMIRHSLYPVTEENWQAAMPFTGVPAPGPPGTVQEFTVSALAALAGHSIAMKTADEHYNWSALSNVIEAPGEDVIPPGVIGDLRVVSADEQGAVLAWTATGDNGSAGTATAYSIRHCEAPLTEETWDAAAVLPGAPTPAPSGTTEQCAVSYAEAPPGHQVGMKAVDDAGNWSPLSNTVAVPAGDQIPPGDINDLTTCSPGAGQLSVTWTAPGDDGMLGQAASYEMRISPYTIGEANWLSATPVPGLPAPSVAGTPESFTIGGLTEGATYYLAIKTRDEAGNTSAVSRMGFGTAGTPTLRRLTATYGAYPPIMSPAFAPDGRSIAFHAGLVSSSADIYTIPADCGRLRRVTAGAGPEYGPGWSPDGRRISYSTNSELCVVDLEEGTAPVILVTDLWNASGGDWSPDGQWIAFESSIHYSAPPKSVIYLVPSSGGEMVPLIDDPSYNANPDWSPDGARIVFSSDRAESFDLWIADVSGGPPRQLTSDPGVETAPDWSPDGTRIAYASNRTGNYDIWVIPAAGGVPTQLTNDAGRDFEPSWSPDGRQIAFTSDRTGHNELWVLTVE